MAGDGLDDELLALAGGSDDERPRKSSSSAANHAATKSDSDLDAHADAHAHAHADADLVSASRKRSSAKPTSISKRRRLDLLDESDSSDQDAPGSDHDASDDSATAQSANPNPYPLYGIYKNQNDMDQLLEMNELDREMVLSERRAQLEKRQQRIELASLVRSQKAAAGATKNKAASNKKKSLQRSKPNRRSLSDLDQSSDDDHDQQDHDAHADSDQDAEGSDYSANFTSAVSSAAKARKKKAVGSTDTKTAKLSELRKRRKEKASGVRRHQSDDDASSPKKRRGTTYLTSDSESDFSDDYGSEDGYGRTNTSAARSKVGRDRDREDRGTGGKREPPSLSDLNSVRISRDLVEHKLYAPKWKEALTGSFIRFSWGMRDRADGQGKEQVYRIHQVQDIIEKPGKFYELSSEGSGKWTNVYLSFEHMGNDYEASLNMLSRSDFTEGEHERWIRAITASDQRIPRKSEIERKAEQLENFFSAVLTEADIQRMLSIKKKLRQEAKTSGYSGRGPTSAIVSPARGVPSSAGANGNGKYDQQVMAQVNDRNRRLDRERILEAERRAAQAKKAALAAVDSPNGSGISSPMPRQPEQDTALTTAQTALANAATAAAAAATLGGSSKSTAAGAVAAKIEIDLGDF